MATKIQVRRDTAANWTSANTVLSEGEIGYEIDTGYMKIGDGTTAWAALSYFSPNPVDNNTTYTYSVAQAGSDATMTLAGTDATNDVVTLIAGTQLTLTVAGDNVTVDVDPDLANYSNATSAFISDITAQAIGSLSDVDVSAVANGSVLSYNSTSGNWEAGDPAVSAISDLSDVDVTSPGQWSHLHWDGANWVDEAVYFYTTKRFAGGMATDRFIELQNRVITIGAISSGDSVDFPTSSAGGADYGIEWQVNNPETDFVANITPGPVNINTSTYFRIIIDNTSGVTKGSISGLERNGTVQTVNWTNGSLPVVRGDDVYDIYEFYCFRGNGGSDETWYGTLLTGDDKLDGDLTGSVFGDDSTLLVDGVNNTIPAVNLSGALPAIDGSNLLNIGVGDNITAVVEDTTPQLGGNLDLNSAEITGTGNIDITGNITNTGDTTVTGTLKVDSGNNIVIEKTVSGNSETFGNIIATTGTTEYAKIEFKTGADGFADNSEINWFSRVGGSSVQIFEIKGSTLGKSGFEINPSANLNVDFFMQGASDPTLIFADAGLDKVGFGKIPTQGKVDVDGDIYATTIRGTIVATAGTAPTAGSDPGDEGEIRFDNDYIYVKTPGGSWKRTALSSIV